MRADSQQNLQAAGWKVGAAADFLELSPEDAALIDVRLSLSRSLKEIRAKSRLTQAALAKVVGSSQSRVAKMESGDASVTLDLIVKSLFAAGASSSDVAKAIVSGSTARKKAVKVRRKAAPKKKVVRRKTPAKRRPVAA